MKIVLTVIAVCFVIFVSVYLVRCNKEYYAGYNAVKDELKKIDGIKVLELWGNEDVTTCLTPVALCTWIFLEVRYHKKASPFLLTSCPQ
jgi:hypothetical protein